MEMVEVESSNVHSIGYDAGAKRLCVRYRDGVSYEHEDITPEFHAALMAAPSKGKFLARHLKGGAKLAAMPLREPAETPSMNTFESDPCCNGNLAKDGRAGKLDIVTSWTCPKCGCEWKCRIVGPLRHWEPHELIATLRV
jgi:hypothetical protein